MSNVGDGHAFMVLGLPSPEEKEICLSEHPAKDSILVVNLLPTGALRLLLRKDDAARSIQDDVTTSSIELVDSNRVLLGITWANHKFVDIEINKVLIFSRQSPAEVVRHYRVEEGARFLTERSAYTDFSDENRRAVQLRSHKMANWTRDPARLNGDADYAFSAIQSERDQLLDLISLVRSGKVAHVPGILSRCRLLTVGKPMGLLQMGAAFKSQPLILYAIAHPQAPLPKLSISPESVFMSTGSATATEVFANPVDLDVWLKFKPLLLKQHHSNGDLIRVLGNTIGSHRDLDIPEPAVFLMKGREISANLLTSYAVSVGEILAALCDQVISIEKRSLF